METFKVVVVDNVRNMTKSSIEDQALLYLYTYNYNIQQVDAQENQYGSVHLVQRLKRKAATNFIVKSIFNCCFFSYRKI